MYSQVWISEFQMQLDFCQLMLLKKAKSGHPGMPMGMADVASIFIYRVYKN